MRAVGMVEFGDPGVLQIVEVPDLPAASGKIRVLVPGAASGSDGLRAIKPSATVSLPHTPR